MEVRLQLAGNEPQEGHEEEVVEEEEEMGAGTARHRPLSLGASSAVLRSTWRELQPTAEEEGGG